MFADRGPEAGSSVLSMNAWIGLRKSIEDSSCILRCDADPGIAYLEPQTNFMIGLLRRADANPNKAFPSELKRIGYEIDQDLLNADVVAQERIRRIRGDALAASRPVGAPCEANPSRQAVQRRPRRR